MLSCNLRIRVSANKRLLTKKASADVNSKVVEFTSPYALWLLDEKTGPAMQTTTNKEELLGFFREMTLMRRVEMAADVAYKNRLIRGFLHLYDGQEAIASGIESEMTPEDHVVTAYRCHAFLLTRRCGTKPVQILAELFGRRLGTSEGKGGSMHMYNAEKGMWGGNGIVGSQVPLGAGVAFAQKYLKKNNVCFTYYGDGAANQGQVFEAYNLAKLFNLPCVFVCENNHYAMGTPVERHSATKEFYNRAEYIPGLKFDGMNVLQSREVAKFAIKYAKEHGPLVLEAETYRYKGHSMSDPGTTYRTQDEVKKIRDLRDPIEYVNNLLVDFGWSTQQELDAIVKEVKGQVDEAVAEATAAAWPEPKELFDDVYAGNPFPIRGTEQFHNGFNPSSSSNRS
jgi:pyruvate dehydrogenase E1 component alpha subunit